MRRKRGFVQVAILHLLNEGPMHGYQIMKELEDRSGGTYSASAGTVYPALQELSDQQFIELDVTGEKKSYSLLPKGRQRMAEHDDDENFWGKWRERMLWKNSEESMQLKQAIHKWEETFHTAMKQARGDKEQTRQLVLFLEEMVEKLELGKKE